MSCKILNLTWLMSWLTHVGCESKAMQRIEFESFLENLEEEALGKYPDQPGLQRAHLCGAFRSAAAYWASLFNQLAEKVTNEYNHA